MVWRVSPYERLEQLASRLARRPGTAVLTAGFASRGVWLLRPRRDPRFSAPAGVRDLRGSAPGCSGLTFRESTGQRRLGPREECPALPTLRALSPGSTGWHAPRPLAPRVPLQSPAFSLLFPPPPVARLSSQPPSSAISTLIGVGLNVTFSRSSPTWSVDRILKLLPPPSP